MRVLLLLLSLVPLLRAADLAIAERPLPFDADRARLTAEYLAAHRTAPAPAGDDWAKIQMTPRAIVLHWTGGPTADSAWNTFAGARLAGRPELGAGGAVNVSAHFLVDRDGSVARLLPETRVARHTIGLNHLAIGVENVGDGARWPLTEAQVQANIDLVRHLKARYPGITHLLGHHEYRRMEGHPYFEERDPDYRTSKPDPGAAFVAAVRAGVADLGLEAPP